MIEQRAYFCVEDPLSQAVMIRLLECLLGLGKENLQELMPDYGGSSYIKSKFIDYCNLAKHEHVFILTDLDRAECPPSLREEWIKQSRLSEPLPSKMRFNVATIEVESWLLADRDNLCAFLGMPNHALPNNVEIPDPKERLLQCVRKPGSRQAKSNLLPERGKSARVGLGYNDHLREFATNLWDFEIAANSNVSLSRAIARIKSMQQIAET